MKKISTLLMALMLMSTALWAEETVTVSANSTDISEGLDLKVVAKLFAEAKNLEEFENKLNNPDSAFCNLDLNGDGQVDYLRVVETGEGNKRLIVLQAILAKDIYQDVASIYVEKDESTSNVSVQVVGDEYVYGKNYIIEPVYVYRPVIYDWFWGSSWYAWRSPYYWGYYPGWWHAHHCWAHDWYWNRCYAWHHHHHWCSFRHGHHPYQGYYTLHGGVSRRDYAVAYPDHSFERRNQGMTNARDIRTASEASHRRSFDTRDGGRRMDQGASARTAATADRSARDSRTFGSRTTAATASSRTATASQRGEATQQRTATAQRSSTTATAQRTATTATATRSGSTSQRSGSTTVQRSGSTRSSESISSQRTSQPQRSQSSSSYSGSRSSSSSSYSGSSSRSSGSYSGGSSSRSGGSYSGGSSRSGGSSSGSRGGGGSSRR